MIVITGATGQLGRGTVERLLDRVPASRVAVSVRSPEKAADLADRDVRVRHGDYADPDSLAEAFEGAEQVLVVSADTLGEEALRLHRNAVDAARAAGAERVLYTSHQAAGPASHFAPAVDHAATEEFLAAGGAYTALRNGFYASTVIRLLGGALHTGVLAAPADGPVSWTANSDLAEAAAAVLAGGGIDGPVTLTADRAVTLDEVAAVAGEVAGREIRRVVVSDEEYAAGLVEHGASPEVAGMMLGMFAATRDGEFDVVDPALADLLGRPPTSLRDYLAAELSR